MEMLFFFNGSDQKRRIRAADRARTARLFRPPNEPRSISWDTIEQIRYLKQESGDEWSTEKLAASFGVTKELIIKVLKSKFTPTEKARRKQDVMAKISTATRRTENGRALLPSSLKESRTRITAPVKSKMNTALEPFTKRDSSSRPQSISGQRSVGRSTSQDEHVSHHPNKPKTDTPRGLSWEETSNVKMFDNLTSVNQMGNSSGVSNRKGKTGGRKSHDRSHFQVEEKKEPELRETEVEEELNIDMENLESYMHITEGTLPPRIIQKGNEFFDEYGELLYRL